MLLQTASVLSQNLGLVNHAQSSSRISKWWCRLELLKKKAGSSSGKEGISLTYLSKAGFLGVWGITCWVWRARSSSCSILTPCCLTSISCCLISNSCCLSFSLSSHSLSFSWLRLISYYLASVPCCLSFSLFLCSLLLSSCSIYFSSRSNFIFICEDFNFILNFKQKLGLSNIMVDPWGVVTDLCLGRYLDAHHAGEADARSNACSVISTLLFLSRAARIPFRGPVSPGGVLRDSQMWQSARLIHEGADKAEFLVVVVVCWGCVLSRHSRHHTYKSFR